MYPTGGSHWLPLAAVMNELHCVLQQRMFIVGAIVTINITAILINFVLDKGQRPPYLSNHIINILRQMYSLTSKPLSSYTGKNKYVPYKSNPYYFFQSHPHL